MTPWISFEWPLGGEAAEVPSVDPLVIAPAGRDDQADVLKVVLTAFAMDSSWTDLGKRLAPAIDRMTVGAFRDEQPACVVARHGQRIIGASVLDADPDARTQLLTGPMILHEYRNRGLGTGLLASSLEFLRGRGLARARGTTRANSIAARFIYPKFGGTQTACEFDPIATATSQKG